MKLIIASNNADKIREIKEILSPYFEDFLSLKEAGIDHETVEDGNSFIENAVKKAREVAQISGRFTIADDSGICVDALDGAPGIYSARFCGRPRMPFCTDAIQHLSTSQSKRRVWRPIRWISRIA